MKYAKLINETTIEFAPKNKGAIINYDINIEAMEADGYKKFVEAEKETGKSYTISYREINTEIIEIAVEIPQPSPEEQLEQAKKNKKQEASDKAYEYLESGEAVFEFRCEAGAQTACEEQGVEQSMSDVGQSPSGAADNSAENIYHIEATDDNIAKLGLKVAELFMKKIQPVPGLDNEEETEETFPWNTKEDVNILLNFEEASYIVEGLENIQADVWTKRFPLFVAEIDRAQTIEDVNKIVIEYV